MDGSRGDSKPATTSAMPKRRGWGGAVVTLVVLGGWGGGGWVYGWPKLAPLFGQTAETAAARNSKMPPQPVGVASIGHGDVRIVLSALGTVSPLATVTVKTQIGGQLVQIAFQEGQLVHKGDFLAQIDPRPYQVALEQAQAQLARDQATLKGAEVDLARYRTLVAQDSIAKQTLDSQVATVGNLQGTVQLDQASIDSAQLNLTYCHITAPATGRVGLRQVDEGNYVQASDANGIVVITQLQPISAVFSLPEDDIPQILTQMHTGRALAVTAADRTDTTTIATGQLSTIDNQVDTTTGTVKLRALFANDDEQLFPSQFVNAHLLVDTLKGAIVAPTSAIQRGEPGTFVYVVGDDSRAHVRPITLGPQDGAVVAVIKGLNGGERVVVDGADRLRDGAPVTVPASPAGGAADVGHPHRRMAKPAAGDQPSNAAPDAAH